MEAATVSQMLRALAAGWTKPGFVASAAAVHEGMALVAQAAATLGIAPTALVEHDLAEMRTRDYLQPWFEQANA